MDYCVVVGFRSSESMNHEDADGKKHWDMGFRYAKCHIRYCSIYLVHNLPFNVPSDLFEIYN